MSTLKIYLFVSVSSGFEENILNPVVNFRLTAEAAKPRAENLLRDEDWIMDSRASLLSRL